MISSTFRQWCPGGRSRLLLVVGSCALFLCCGRDVEHGSTPALAQAPQRDDVVPTHLLKDERNTIDVFRRTAPSVVYITNKRLRRQPFSLNVMEIPQGSGSGFLWDEDGHVVTNFHVIQNGNVFSVTFDDGTVYEASVVGYEPNKDLAVLKIEAHPDDIEAIELGDSSNLMVGQKVLAIGNPFGLDHTLTTGVISALGREIRSVANTTIRDVIQTDASINPGNSGGPLLDSGGRLIGVNTAIYSASGQSAGIGFAVPVNTVKRVVPQLIEYGRVRRAGLGVTLFPDAVVRRWRIRGAVIQQVVPGGAAARAGMQGAEVDARGRIRLGDIIVGIDDHQVETYDDLFTALDRRQVGEQVTVHFMREGELRSTDVGLIELE